MHCLRKLPIFLLIGLGLGLIDSRPAQSQVPPALAALSQDRAIVGADLDSLPALSLRELLSLASSLPHTAYGHHSLLAVLPLVDEILKEREMGDLFSELVVTEYRDDFGVRYLEQLLLGQEEEALRLFLNATNRSDTPRRFAYAFIVKTAAAWKHRQVFSSLPRSLRLRVHALEALMDPERTSRDAQVFASMAHVQNLPEPEILRAALVGGGDPRMPVFVTNLSQQGNLRKLQAAAALELSQAEQFIAEGSFPENGRLLTLFLRTMLSDERVLVAWGRTEAGAIAARSDSPVRAHLSREIERALRGQTYYQFAAGRAALIGLAQAFGLLGMVETEREFAALEQRWRMANPRLPLPGTVVMYRRLPLSAFLPKDQILYCQEKVDDSPSPLSASALF